VDRIRGDGTRGSAPDDPGEPATGDDQLLTIRLAAAHKPALSGIIRAYPDYDRYLRRIYGG
jgi:hypothetical protein